MPQEFYAITGYSPPYAAYLLRNNAKRVVLGDVTLIHEASKGYALIAASVRTAHQTNARLRMV